MVGGFTWALDFRWEPAASTGRLPLPSATETGPDAMLLSPAAPGIFAIRTAYYKELNGFDANLKTWGAESIEMSLHVWRCGGYVMRQPCSRVAHLYNNLFTDSPASAHNAVRQKDVDMNVMLVAEHWFEGNYKELIHHARFLNRIPYSVMVSSDGRVPAQYHYTNDIATSKCANQDWYLTTIYPGLLQDVPEIQAAYAQQVNTALPSDIIPKEMASVLAQYRGHHQISANTASKEMQDKLFARSQTAQNYVHGRAAEALYPPPIYSPAKQKKLHVKSDPKPVDIFLTDAHGDPHELHANHIRSTMFCEDEILPKGKGKNPESCEARVARGACHSDRYYMMFGCPKACGWCAPTSAAGSSATDKPSICVDFYENKCPIYKKEGKCEDADEGAQMKHDCSYSCGQCKPLGGSKGFKDAFEAAALGSEVHVKTEEQKPKPKPVVLNVADPPKAHGSQDVNEANALLLQMPLVNHHQLQEDWADGYLPAEPKMTQRSCEEQQKTSDAKVLNAVSFHAQGPRVYTADDRAKIAAKLEPEQVFTHKTTPSTSSMPTDPAPTGARLFCGIYTMQENHLTNVKSTRETWAKRCDGFIAFSTVTDLALPAVAVRHEGEESYDNMWQKSRR